MPNIKHNEELSFDDSIKISSSGNPILGVLAGPCADIIDPTRNGRKYDDSLWEKVFNDDIIKEYFECGGIFGELGHPVDRTETDMEKIAICMPKPPVKGDDGALTAKFDILDTPNGRIAYTLAKYGYKLGVSSRGSGDTYVGSDGKEHVDEDTYDFQAFDLVLLPAVKKARLSLISEGYGNKTFKQAINEQLEKSSDSERKIMTETLSQLDIDFQSDGEDNTESEATALDSDDIVVNSADLAADDDRAIIEDLQQALKENKELKEQLSNLQAKLSVSNAKEHQLTEELTKYKQALVTLSDQAKASKALKAKVENLQENLTTTKQQLTELQTKQVVSSERSSAAEQRISTYKVQVTQLNEQIESLKAASQKAEKENSLKLQSLAEQLSDAKKDSEIKHTEYQEKLEQQSQLVEKYKNIARKAINKYIESQAVKLGVSTNEIKARLSETYSFSDIDRVCEELQSYKVNISKLPFNMSRPVKARISESKQMVESLLPTQTTDDTIDEQLISLAQLN